MEKELRDEEGRRAGDAVVTDGCPPRGAAILEDARLCGLRRTSAVNLPTLFTEFAILDIATFL